MDCQKAMNMLSLYVDGSLSSLENRAIQEHLSTCIACNIELNLQKRLSGVMNSFDEDELEAPPTLCANIMGQLRQERKSLFYWLTPAWRRTIAAAAAVLLMFGMSAGIIGNLATVANKGKAPSAISTPQVAEKNGNAVSNQGNPVSDNVAQPKAIAQPPDNGEPSGDKNTVPQTETINSVQTNSTDNQKTQTIDEIASKTVPNSNKPVVVATKPSNQEKPILLSSKMNVVSTMLKVSVADPSEARIKAVALAAGTGATTQVFPEQNGSKKILVMRLTVATEHATGLIGGLTELGTIIDRQDENRDITSSYNQTLVQYTDLVNTLKASTDPEERKQLEAQAAGLKKMLDSWQAEAGKRVIVLWLEEK